MSVLIRRALGSMLGPLILGNFYLAEAGRTKQQWAFSVGALLC